MAFYRIESSSNTSLVGYWDALGYASDVALGTKLTSLTPVTFQGRIISSLLALLRLVFFGFVSSMILTYLQIYLKKKELGYLRGASRNVH